jgi:hypothetical protein
MTIEEAREEITHAMEQRATGIDEQDELTDLVVDVLGELGADFGMAEAESLASFAGDEALRCSDGLKWLGPVSFYCLVAQEREV